MPLLDKFPRTPHIFWLSKQPLRDDKLIPPNLAEEILERELVIEEKVDGANLGFSLTSQGTLQIQNRGNYLTGALTGQFGALRDWIAQRTWLFQEALHPDQILFGEWCFAKHSVAYSRLPDWFLGFDVYQRGRSQFLSTTLRDDVLSGVQVTPVRTVARGKFSKRDLLELLKEPSAYTGEKMEGIYIRWETEEFLEGRAKLVNPDFVTGIAEHWSRGELVRNQLDSEREGKNQ